MTFFTQFLLTLSELLSKSMKSKWCDLRTLLHNDLKDINMDGTSGMEISLLSVHQIFGINAFHDELMLDAFFWHLDYLEYQAFLPLMDLNFGFSRIANDLESITPEKLRKVRGLVW